MREILRSRVSKLAAFLPIRLSSLALLATDAFAQAVPRRPSKPVELLKRDFLKPDLRVQKLTF